MGSPRGTKRAAEYAPDDPRLVSDHGPEAEVVTDAPTPAGQPQSFRPADMIEKPRSARSIYAAENMCATCGMKFGSKNKLHVHLREAGHRVIGGEPERPTLVIDNSDDDDASSDDDDRAMTASQARRAILDHHARNWGPISDCIGSTIGPSGTKTDREGEGHSGLCESNSRILDPKRLLLGKPVRAVDSVHPGHPGPVVETRDITARDQRWIDIGSGIVSRTFIGAEHLPVTSKNGPSLVDVHSRKIWSLSTGRLVDECVIDDVPDDILYRKLPAADNLRIELTLKDAVSLFERKGPDIAEIFSQPRICQEVGGRNFKGQQLKPGSELGSDHDRPQDRSSLGFEQA